MKFAKPPLTIEQQADLLIQRGMQGDRAVMIERLTFVNYYRLSGYWHPFRNPDSTFKPNTKFDRIWDRYVFDRRLRLLVMDAIERIEVAVRASLAFEHSHMSADPFAYATNPAALGNLSPEEKNRLLNTLQEETANSKETFADHFRIKYGADNPYMPVWMICELMTFGSLLMFFRGSPSAIQQSVAKRFGVHDVVLKSWLLTLNTIRNVCAHHGRLWNRELGVKPKIPDAKKHPEWHAPVSIPPDRMFGVLTICRHCLKQIAPQSHWQDRFETLLDEFPYVPRGSMGMLTNWKDSPIWK